MPVRNEGDFIATSLGAVLSQSYPHDRMEVFIADGMSTDDTRSIINALAQDTPSIPVTIIDNPGRIVPTGLNRALEHAKGEIIIRVDGHCTIAPDYVARCVDHLQQEEVDGVGGPIETIAPTTVGQAIATAMSSAFGVGGSAFRTIKDRTMLVDTVAFPAYTRQAIEKAGPFDEELVRNQDDEYNYRLRKLGSKILLAADVQSQYYSRSSLSSLWRQYYQYGFWKVRVLQKHPRQMSLRQFVPVLFVLSLIGGAILAVLHPLYLWGWLGIIALYSAANLMASVFAAQKAGWYTFLYLPLAFAAMHTAYGLGFLVGLIRFINRWGDRE